MTGQENIDMHDRTMSGTFSKTVPYRHRTALRLAFASAISLGLATVMLPGETQADFDDRWFRSKREFTLKERRAQRRQFSDAFTAKFGPEYQTNIPYVSHQIISLYIRM